MKNIITRRAALVAVVLLVCCCLLATNCRKTPGTNGGSGRPFRIGMVSFAGYAPLYLAKEKGFFGDLDVQLERIEEVPSIRAAIVRGDLNAYLATPDIALDTNTKPPGKAVWAIDESAGGAGVVVSGEIQDLSGLKGKKVAAEPGLPPNFVLLYLLHKNGMSIKDVNFQDMTTQNAAAAFASKSVDAAGIYEPYLSQAMKQRKGSRVVISSKQTPGLIVDLVFVRDDEVAPRSADVLKLIEGWRKAMKFINDSPSEAFDIMAKAFNLPVEEFRDTVGGIRWLDLPENQALFGTDQAPGPLYDNFGVVVDVLRHNRADVFQATAGDYLIRTFIQGAK